MTQIPAEVVYLLLAVSVVVALLVVAFFIFATYRATVPGLVAQWRTAVYAYRYDDALTWLGAGRKERASLVTELRANIADAAGATSVPDALAGLGDPRDLARGVTAGPLRPRWGVGAAAGVVAFVVIQLVAIVGADLFAAGAAAATEESVSVTGHTAFLPGATFSASIDVNGAPVSIGYSLNLLLALGVPLLIGLLVAAPWRLWTAKRAA